MQSMPHTGRLPIMQPAPAGHAVTVAQLQRQVFSRHPRAHHIDDAVDGLLIADTRPSTFVRTLHLRNQWLYAFPQRNGDLLATCHARNFFPITRQYPRKFICGSWEDETRAEQCHYVGEDKLTSRIFHRGDSPANNINSLVFITLSQVDVGVGRFTDIQQREQALLFSESPIFRGFRKCGVKKKDFGASVIALSFAIREFSRSYSAQGGGAAPATGDAYKTRS
ncbi:hypothetical protein XBLMG947_1783 [Xanthomonas bromi]|uniref:Uncharacterized protein n=1 Tax=Xanthomonas bromi TaxID=56449 RepID=A0A1C3NKP8_9XANT|nr:hypothetical protein XBLMG947_1783 [Xanthomonas bromi]